MAKKSHWYIYVIILLLLILFALIGYLLADKNVFQFKNFPPTQSENKENEEPQEEEKKEEKVENTTESLDVNSNLVLKYASLYSALENSCQDSSSLKNDLKTKLYLAYLAIPSSYYQTVRCGNLQSTVINSSYYCASKYKEDLDSPTIASELAEENTTYIPEELIKMQYEEIFGLNSNYQKDDIQIIGGMYHYDALLKGYAYYRINAGGGCPLADISVVEAVKNNNTLTLMLQKKYGDEAQGDWQNEIITYTLLYEEETGNYIFQNVQKE